MASQRGQQRQSRLELLPGDLRLVVLEHISCLKELTRLVISSRPYHETYLTHKRRILACVAQTTLGEWFVDACMLQHWKSNLDTYLEDGKDRVRCFILGHWLSNLGNHQTIMSEDDVFEKRKRNKFELETWPRGEYRHIQLKFIHEYRQYDTANIANQIKQMQRLLTAEDFIQALSYHYRVMRPRTLHHEILIALHREWNTPPEASPHTAAGRRRIMKSYYRFQIWSALYGPKPEGFPQEQWMEDLTRSRIQVAELDFLGRFDADAIREMMKIFCRTVLFIN